jgi:hypothetical protein
MDSFTMVCLALFGILFGILFLLSYIYPEHQILKYFVKFAVITSYYKTNKSRALVIAILCFVMAIIMFYRIFTQSP